MTTLNLARSTLSALGFVVAPDAQHPFGTGNCCVFFREGNYLEPITIVDRTAADVAASNRIEFVRRLKRFTERQGKGFAMLALRSEDAEADRAAFEAAGVGAGEVFRFMRIATQPDGSARDVGVALAFAELPGAKDATLFACQHLARDALFQPDYLNHPNGATGIAVVVAVAVDPEAFAAPLAAIAGAGEPATLSVLTPAAFRERYGVDAPHPRRGLLFAAIEIKALDLDVAGRYAGRLSERRDDRVVVPAGSGLGAVIAFRSVGNG